MITPQSLPITHNWTGSLGAYLSGQLLSKETSTPAEGVKLAQTNPGPGQMGTLGSGCQAHHSKPTVHFLGSKASVLPDSRSISSCKAFRLTYARTGENKHK